MAAHCGHWQLRGFGPFAVALKSTDTFVGYCGPWFPYDWPEHELIWGIVASHQRQGFASEAALAARHWAYTQAGWPGAVSYVDAAQYRVAGRRPSPRSSRGRDVTIRGYELKVMRHPSAEQIAAEKRGMTRVNMAGRCRTCRPQSSQSKH